MVVLNLYLIRHGETSYNKAGILQGQLDIPLSEIGRDQENASTHERQRLAEAKVLPKADLVYSSPLSRALETAKIATNDIGEERIICDDLLKEKGMGKLEGKLRSEVDWNSPEMEADADVKYRAVNFLRSLIEEAKVDKTILIFAHGFLLKMLFRHFLGLKNFDFGEYKAEAKETMKNTAFHHIVIKKTSGWIESKRYGRMSAWEGKAIAINNAKHLEEEQ
ncbi:Oidioi.mRNA.OKI2018_I69.chr2.g8083.t1.cds [Oikopleura dioica]|uniref:Fructose-2,6-bisphosphatase TIGAR n=1 Tax=Oikopleura dioica TaxID=34765 RepID=A0ABN7TEF8_OIKDI|nr:Oidioi.mRNA.OKI2018_I69.chr2.g8083.t1.cds [Oikopleura dioica]